MIFSTIANRVVKESKIVVTTKPKREKLLASL